MSRTSRNMSGAGRSGFTLIEMLVATGLVVLIMSIFAEVFALAAASIRDSRSVARTDSRNRVAFTNIAEDLRGVTFGERIGATGLARGLVPLTPGENLNGDSLSRQQGYFYYSENNPENDTDDVLQFTTDLQLESDGQFRFEPSEIPPVFEGKAQLLFDAAGTGPYTDQPEWDDGVGDLNGATPADDGSNDLSRSRYAEVAYFLRGGTLYKRRLLLRDVSGDGQPSRPGATTPVLLLDAGQPLPRVGNYTDLRDVTDPPNDNADAVPDGGSDFHNDFDFAATRIPIDRNSDGDTADTNEGTGLWFHSRDSLEISSQRSLGIPQFRTGHVPLADFPGAIPTAPFAIGDTLPGNPLEFLRGGGGFIGRFTLGEMSANSDDNAATDFTGREPFVFPGLPAIPGQSVANTNPFFRTGLTVGNTAANSAGVTAYSPGPRAGADILLTGVERFDVEIWDDFLREWVDLGYADRGAGLNGVWGNRDPVDNTVLTSFKPAGSPSYGPALSASSTAANRLGGREEDNRVFDTWHPAVDLDRDNTFDPPPFFASTVPFLDSSPVATGLSGYTGAWQPNAMPTDVNYVEGDVVRQTGIPDFSLVFVVDEVLPLTGPPVPSTVQPTWPTVAGGRVIETRNEGRVVWRAVSPQTRFPIGLKRMRVVIQYFDRQTERSRQVTIEHSFAG